MQTRLENYLEQPIRGVRIDLTPANIDFAKDIVKNGNDYDVAKYNIGMPHPLTEQHVKKVVYKDSIERKEGKGCLFWLYEKQICEAIGGIGFENIDQARSTAELGYWIGKEHWKKGYATEAIELILCFGFMQLQLQQIFALVHPINNQSEKLLKKCGFEKMICHSSL